MRGNEEVIEIAKLDATANEVPDLEIRGFPTITFFPNDGSEMNYIEYHGDRTSDAFIAWLKAHAKKGVIKEDRKDIAGPKADDNNPLIEGTPDLELSNGYNAGRGHSDEM